MNCKDYWLPHVGPKLNWYIPLSLKGREIADRYHHGPCRGMFADLARESIDDLIALCKSGALEPANLTFAAETLGQEAEENFRKVSANQVLVDLLQHNSPLVREGVLYGLHHLYDDDNKGLNIVLKEVAAKDPSATIRKIAEELMYMEE